MAFGLSTDDALTALRAAIGASVTVGTTTLTWTQKVEGPPLRWLPDAASYPLIILQPQDTENADAASLLQLDLPVEVYVVVKAASAGASGLAASAYKTIRLVGEKVVAAVMDAGPRLGTNWLERRFVSGGVDYDLSEALNDHGLLVYKAVFALRYYESEVAAT